MNDAGRKAFEGWAIERGHPLSDIVPKYGPTSSLPQNVRRFSDIAWEAWQASRKQALEEAMALFPQPHMEYFGATIQEEIQELLK